MGWVNPPKVAWDPHPHGQLRSDLTLAWPIPITGLPGAYPGVSLSSERSPARSSPSLPRPGLGWFADTGLGCAGTTLPHGPGQAAVAAASTQVWLLCASALRSPGRPCCLSDPLPEQMLWAPRRGSSGLGPAHPSWLWLPSDASPPPPPGGGSSVLPFPPWQTPAPTSLGKLEAPFLGHISSSFSPSSYPHGACGCFLWFGVPRVVNLESMDGLPGVCESPELVYKMYKHFFWGEKLILRRV